ncbi:S9 family peptidase [Sphingomonas lutea]|uniref:S9 family peptidase n=1 Tax=Sphingomonas lutea TaxID=1045317 RepID=A0A7G9SGR4_9SPHN|nr:prolyl oligopeptidase family serine peptidase [Sphingomonas lutea]QNN67039.1 S9 family peptidase [Sphingomonas lutea]
MRAWLVASLLLTAPVALAAQTVETRTVGSATLQNVPAIPADVKAAVQRYQNYREAVFRDWLPDGTMLITTRFGATNQVHRVAAPGAARTQLTFFEEPVAGAEVIPGTSRYVLSRDTGGDEWFQYFATGPTGEPVQLTEPGTRNLFNVFSKDGRLIVWSRATKGSPDYAILAADPADPTSGRVVFQGKGSISPTDISADKRRVLIGRNISNRETRLSILDLATGQATELPWTSESARYESARFTPDGRGVLVITDYRSDLRRLVEIDLASGSRRAVSPDLKWDVEAFDMTDDGRILAYVVNEDGFSRLRLIDRASGRELPQPQLPGGVLSGLGFSPDGSKLALSMSTARSAGDVWSLDVASGTLTRWTNSELGPLDPKTLAEPQLVRFPSFDGLSVPAFVYRPAGIAAGTRTPVLIDIHGGPEAQTRPIWNPGAQYFANVLGATVILPNVRGSDGYGKRYLNLDNWEKREDSVKDIGALLDWIAKQPSLDASKVAVYGQSYGGYMSLAAMTHYSNRLVGGVERYGISDFITFLNNTEAYRRDNRRAEYGDERVPAMRAVFQRINPLANVKKIGKPMLVMQGANDPRVPKSESDQVVAEIRRNGVDAWYVVFADEGHGFLKKPNNDLRREVETVFLRKLFEGR